MTRYIPKFWERSVKRRPNVTFIRGIKNSSFDQNFIPCSERLRVSSATLSCNTWNISTMPTLVQYKKNTFCLILKVPHAVVCLVHYQGLKCLCWSSLFKSFIPSLLLNLTTLIYNLFWRIKLVSFLLNLFPLLAVLWLCLLWYYCGLSFISNFWKLVSFFNFIFLNFHQ